MAAEARGAAGTRRSLAASPREPLRLAPAPLVTAHLQRRWASPIKGRPGFQIPGPPRPPRFEERFFKLPPSPGPRSRPGACRRSGVGRGMLRRGRAEGAPALSAQAHASRGLHWRGLLGGAFPARSLSSPRQSEPPSPPPQTAALRQSLSEGRRGALETLPLCLAGIQARSARRSPTPTPTPLPA